MKHEISRAIEHILETNPLRRKFWHMDEKVDGLRFGIKQGDDAIIVNDMIVNIEGPYPLKIGRKTGLIHTCSDVVVMGGKPLFALNSMQVDNIRDAEDISEDLKRQSQGLGVPIIGGNTQLEGNLKPCISFTVFGRLINKPIPDSGVRNGDRIFMLGEVMEGEIGERVHRAKVRYNTFLDLIKNGVEIHASKDCSRGGWFGNLTEILVKSKKGIKITSIPYPRITRYLGNYLIGIPKKEIKKTVEISAKHKCPIIEVGTIRNELGVSIGDETVVSKEEMQELIRKFPYTRAKL